MATIAAAQLDFHRRIALLLHPADSAPKTVEATFMSTPEQRVGRWEILLGLSPEEAYSRRREWNREPLSDLFPRIPSSALECLLDICIAKNFTYDLSQGKLWNARRYTALTVAHVRHQHSPYDSLLKEGVERFEARRQSATKVWKVLRDWCPWDSSNQVLEKCFQATLLPPEQREADYAFVDDPMDIDSESEFGLPVAGESTNGLNHAQVADFVDDPMEID